jgi:uncharacterized integral membrane protein (TIGR00698 family)
VSETTVAGHVGGDRGAGVGAAGAGRGAWARPLVVAPGVALLFVIGYGGKVIEHTINATAKAHGWTVPNIEYVLWAIVLGLIVGNVVRLPAIVRPGVDTYEFWLKAGIVLLGARFLLGDVARLGGVSLGLVVIEIAASMAFMTWLGRVFGLKPKLTTLLAVGSSVCGVSAIIATQGAIGADDEDASVAITAILVLGGLSLVVFPLVGHALGLSDHAYGLWAGLGVDNTAEATAAGALYSDAAGKVAVLAKTTRNALIGFVVLGYALYWARRGQAMAVGNRAAFLWEKFPKFVLGFLLISLLATVGVFSKDQIGSLANLSRWAFLLTFAGVGLRTDLRQLRTLGLRPFAVGALGEVVIAVLTLGLVLGAQRVVGF